MKEYNSMNFVKNAILIINIIVILMSLIGLYIGNVYLLYFNMGMLSVLLLLLILTTILYEHNYKVERKKNAN